MARRWRNDRYPTFTQVVRHEFTEWHPQMSGVKIRTIPRIAVEFGVFGPEFTAEAEDGTVSTHAYISGGVYDLDADAADKGWTDEEQQLIEAKLDEIAEQQAWTGIYREVEVAPAAPWPTYDNAEPGKVADLAVALGLVEQALAYEVATKQRRQVVAGLEKARMTAEVEEELTAA